MGNVKFQQGLEDIIGKPLFLKTMDEDRWATLENGEHVLLGSDGEIKAGMGGKFTGQKIGEIGKSNKKTSNSNPHFGDAGIYHVYRAGSLETQRGIISFSTGKELADSYANLPAHEGTGGTKEYSIDIKSPLLIEAQTSMGATQAAHEKLLGKKFDNSKPNAQRNADKRIAKEMERQGYDALMLKIDYFGKSTPDKYEILIPNKYKKNIKAKEG